jgi:hypothetical protein
LDIAKTLLRADAAIDTPDFPSGGKTAEELFTDGHFEDVFEPVTDLRSWVKMLNGID